MIGPRPIDVLLVGENVGSEARTLRDGGLAVETSPDCLTAIVSLARTRARVVVFPHQVAEGRLQETAEGLRDAGDEPELLVCVPPDYDSEEIRATGLPTIEQPFFPEQFLHRVRVQLERDHNRALGLIPAGPALAPDELSLLVADIAEMNRHVPEFDDLLDSLLGIFLRRSSAHRASLLLHDSSESELRLVRSEGFPEDVEVEDRIPIGRGIAGRAAVDRRPVVVPDVGLEPWAELANGGDYRTTSCISIPLMAGEILQGVLNLADRADGRPFSEADLPVLARLAPQAGLTLDNARRMRELRKLSFTDDLTGLLNPRSFRRLLGAEFARALRYSRPITLAILDLDHFKAYNDLNGHEAGNRALERIGHILNSSFRETDIPCRYGGEEFAIILPETEKGTGPEEETTSAHHFLERVRARIESEEFEGEANLPDGCLTVSGGVASYPADAATAQELKDVADRALYEAKDAGRNRIHLA